MHQVYYIYEYVMRDPIPRLIVVASFLGMGALGDRTNWAAARVFDHSDALTAWMGLLALFCAFCTPPFLAGYLTSTVVRAIEASRVRWLSMTPTLPSVYALMGIRRTVFGEQNRIAAYDALIDRLPELMTVDRSSIPASALRNLNRLLSESGYLPLSLALMEIAPRFGNSDTLAATRTVAAYFRGTQHAEVIDRAATTCSRQLLASLEQDKAQVASYSSR